MSKKPEARSQGFGVWGLSAAVCCTLLLALLAQPLFAQDSPPPPGPEDISPTRSTEAYEKARSERIFRSSLPTWAVAAGTELDPLPNAEFRIPFKELGGLPQEDPRMALTKLTLSGERFLMNTHGLLSVGLDLSALFSMTGDPYAKTKPAIWSVAPSVHYEFAFIPHQLLVPSVRLDYEVMRYVYNYHSFRVHGVKQIPRADLGVMLYLNFFEPMEGANIQESFGIKRTYLAAYYTSAFDASKKDFNASETAWKLDVRFEF